MPADGRFRTARRRLLKPPLPHLLPYNVNGWRLIPHKSKASCLLLDFPVPSILPHPPAPAHTFSGAHHTSTDRHKKKEAFSEAGWLSAPLPPQPRSRLFVASFFLPSRRPSPLALARGLVVPVRHPLRRGALLPPGRQRAPRRRRRRGGRGTAVVGGGDENGGACGRSVLETTAGWIIPLDSRSNNRKTPPPSTHP